MQQYAYGVKHNESQKSIINLMLKKMCISTWPWLLYNRYFLKLIMFLCKHMTFFTRFSSSRQKLWLRVNHQQVPRFLCKHMEFFKRFSSSQQNCDWGLTINKFPTKLWLRVNNQQVPNTDHYWGLTINRFLTHFTNLNTMLQFTTNNFTWPRSSHLRCYQPLPASPNTFCRKH